MLTDQQPTSNLLKMGCYSRHEDQSSKPDLRSSSASSLYSHNLAALHQSVYMARSKVWYWLQFILTSAPDLDRQGKERRIQGRANQKLLLIDSRRVTALAVTQCWSPSLLSSQGAWVGSSSSYMCPRSVRTSPAHTFHFWIKGNREMEKPKGDWAGTCFPFSIAWKP